jgi:predicted enzyme related to lactoylglutathione lyase
MPSRGEEPGTPGWPSWLGLVVEDLGTARRFYGALFDLEETDAGEDWVQFDLGQGRLVELLRRDPEQVQYDRARFQPGFAVVDIARARERAIALGAEAITGIEGGPAQGGYWCYFRDPEGHVFEVQQLVPSEADPSAGPRVASDG